MVRHAPRRLIAPSISPWQEHSPERVADSARKLRRFRRHSMLPLLILRKLPTALPIWSDTLRLFLVPNEMPGVARLPFTRKIEKQKHPHDNALWPFVRIPESELADECSSPKLITLPVCRYDRYDPNSAGASVWSWSSNPASSVESLQAPVIDEASQHIGHEARPEIANIPSSTLREAAWERGTFFPPHDSFAIRAFLMNTNNSSTFSYNFFRYLMNSWIHTRLRLLTVQRWILVTCYFTEITKLPELAGFFLTRLCKTNLSSYKRLYEYCVRDFIDKLNLIGYHGGLTFTFLQAEFQGPV